MVAGSFFLIFHFFSQQLITVWLVTVQVWFAAVIVAVLCLLRGCCDMSSKTFDHELFFEPF